MKLHQLKETPLDGESDFRALADSSAEKNNDFFSKLPITAEIDDYILRSNNSYLSLWANNELIASLKMVKLTDKSVEVDDLWVKKEYEGKKLINKLLWYLKSRENFHQIYLGNVHSKSTKSMITTGLHAFDKFWINHMTGEKIPLNPADVDKYYPNVRWKLMLENDIAEHDNMPRFYVEGNPNGGFMRMSYKGWSD